MVHILDDLPPTDARVVGAEGDLPELRGIGDDADFGAPEVVVEQILEPHSSNHEDVPRKVALFECILERPVASSRLIRAQIDREDAKDAKKREEVREGGGN